MATRHVSMLVIAAAVGAAILLAGAAAVWRQRVAVPAPARTALEQLGNYGSVPPFTLTERSGRRVTRDDLRGLVWVADFIYTECTESCPTQSLQLAQLQREFDGVHDLRLVSITVDPEHDTPEVLRRYAERYEAGDRWWFLTGDKTDIHFLAQQGFRLSVVDPAASAQPTCGQALRLGPAPAWASHGSKGLVMHSARAVLVDRAGRIRAYHLATEPESMTSLRANLRRLLAEPPRHEQRAP
jgi:cytochrome oxidase Cu insertion factor (SCO1/SenC/PrrC family)